jgi:hypothetical protein
MTKKLNKSSKEGLFRTVACLRRCRSHPSFQIPSKPDPTRTRCQASLYYVAQSGSLKVSILWKVVKFSELPPSIVHPGC